MLRNKTVLIVSPQAWGKMFLSKHHYAIELARRQNTVYFLNPPQQGKLGKRGITNISRSPEHENLFLIDHAIGFPYVLKFRVQSLFHWLMRFHINRVVKSLGRKLDVIWSFDIGNLYPLASLDAGYRIFHPVDEPLNREAVRSAKGAQIIFSVTKEILEKYRSINVPKHFINHGLAEELFVTGTLPENKQVHVGFSGNLLRADIDRPVLLSVINRHPSLVFEFWGSFQPAESNIGGNEDIETADFIRVLQKCTNVVLHGAVTPKVLAAEMRRMDVFLICYDIKRDQSKGTNYHKIMEYLSTGKVTVSNNVTTYRDYPGLIEMTDSRENNAELPGLFEKIISQLSEYNRPERMKARISFALNNTYSKQVDRIEKIIYG
jgi:hypothetical protein